MSRTFKVNHTAQHWLQEARCYHRGDSNLVSMLKGKLEPCSPSAANFLAWHLKEGAIDGTKFANFADLLGDNWNVREDTQLREKFLNEFMEFSGLELIEVELMMAK